MPETEKHHLFRGRRILSPDSKKIIERFIEKRRSEKKSESDSLKALEEALKPGNPPEWLKHKAMEYAQNYYSKLVFKNNLDTIRGKKPSKGS